MAEPHPIPRHPAFKDLTGRTMGSGVRVVHFLGRKLWLAVCLCGREFTAGGAALLKGLTVRCPECRSPSDRPATKACRACKRVLPFTEEHFPTSAQHPFGLRARCRNCVNAVARVDARSYTRDKRLTVLRHYGGNPPACLCCGETAYEFLSLDHLDGGSQEDYRKHKNTDRYMASIIRAGFPPRFRVLCHNCNQCCRLIGHCVHAPDRIKFHRPLEVKPAITLVAPPDIGFIPSQQCIKCSRTLPMSPDFFSRHPMMATGLICMCKDCQRAFQRHRSRALKAQRKHRILSHYSGGEPQCACCDQNRIEFLAVDHVDGGGAKHRRELRGGDLYRWLVQNHFPSGFQCLCHNCNQSRGYYGYCPCSR